MPNVKKIIEKMKIAPNTIKCADAVKVLEYNGYRLDRQKGSYMQYIKGTSNKSTFTKFTL